MAATERSKKGVFYFVRFFSLFPNFSKIQNLIAYIGEDFVTL